MLMDKYTWDNFTFISRHYHVKGKAKKSVMTQWASSPKQGTIFRLAQ